ncbi:hypothetical protein [Gillisia marina]|uniref:hypothetical protein n=1 Tax=Gillisia marina TaxID=1167637 RepID=UPI000299EF26|nr:hypothetical protein [Gillisia marina]
MEIATIRLLFDTGLVVLIWMIQLVVYPSFEYYNKVDLIKWHKRYTTNISFIVIPLMFGQLIMAIFQVFQLQNYKTLLGLSFIIAVWLSTFLQFVPIHNKIAKGLISDKLLSQLVTKNWLRTFLWTLIFGWSIYSVVN